MATVTKDFKIKYGLVVEGTTATVNGYSILTKSVADQNYIIGLIGGSATPQPTPDTVVLRDNTGSFSAVNITANSFIGDLDGTASFVNSLSNLSTSDLAEGSRLYYTDDRVKDVLTNATTTNITIEEIGGVLHINAENGVDDSTTDDLTEGFTNKYYTDGRARQALSEGTGINYDASSGTISADLADFTTDNLNEGSNKYFSTARVDNHLFGGDGINYSSGTISADVGTGLTTAAGQIDIDRSTVDGWYDTNGAASAVQNNLDDHTEAVSGVHGVIGNVVGTTDTQDLSNKRFVDTVYFTDGTTIANEAEIAVRAVSHDFDVKANYGDLNLTSAAGDVNITSTTGDIVLQSNGGEYIGSVSAGNQIATNAYVDNAVSGLTWKQAVNLLYDAPIPALSGSGASQLIIDGHDPLGDADSGYRVLVTQSSDAGIYIFNSTSGNWTLTRAADADTYEELVGSAVFVMEGTQYGQTSWIQSNHYLSSFSSQSWTQFSGSGSVVAGSGITVDGLEVSIDRATVDTWYDAAGAASDVQTNLNNHANDTSTHGVGEIVGTSEAQTILNKTIDASSNTLLNIPNLSLENYTITVNGKPTDLGSSVTLSTDDVAEGVLNDYFTQARARESLSAGNAISYNNGTGEIAVDASQLDTDDIAEGTSNKYYTDSRVKDVLVASTQSNISITEVAGELIITAENGVDDSTTDDLAEGANNHYFTDERAKIAAADLLVNHSTQNNITITGDENGLIITAENGVADATTDDLDEGDNNLYFTNQRAVDAINNATIYPTVVDINDYRREEATQQYVATASTVTAHTFTGNRSVKYLARVVGSVSGTLHSQITELVVTVDGNNNVHLTEYGSVHTTEPALATFTADYDSVASEFRLRVTTANNAMEVIVAATIMSWAD